MVLIGQCSAELSDAQIAGAARRTLPSGALAWSRGQEVVAVVPVREPPTSAAVGRGLGKPTLEERWRRTLLELGPDAVIVAVGSMAQEPKDL
ncbi:hypothetical protein ACQ1ZK_17550, partial [Enterococcus faecium]